MKAKSLGAAGESFAVKWLVRKGYQIIKQNYHAPGGEIDVIAWCPRDKVCLMIEVKTRSHDNGISAINRRKVKRMQSAAAHYFFKTLDRKYAPDFECWGLAVYCDHQKPRGQKLSVTEFVPVG